jgi:hypothetical protein
LIFLVIWLGFVHHCHDGTRRTDVTVDERESLADRFEANRTHLAPWPGTDDALAALGRLTGLQPNQPHDTG